jgi:phospholipase/carboxylesterase
MSRRNYVAISLRGPHLVAKAGVDRPAYTWESDDADDELIEDYVVRAVAETRRNFHIHSERIYLVGICEGAATAYRLGLSMPEKLAGIVSLNGHMPAPGSNRPLFRLPELRQLRVLIGHGIANSTVPLGLARRDYQALYSAGLNVKMETYGTTHRLHPDMLRDVNRWIMKQITGDEY